ncbi:hypothetical protein I7L49_09240 [Neisseria meningitidis]|nr:hypothetical protein [Neisseria meningitidis]MBH5851804.1 hypothetical protein [Neisseria meningitidis]MBH6132258.1 hypothetical protein [Neisseria meningitidis]MBH6251236.1 hypothetical protein [Neisseria meningitidis]MBH6572010.1 hypothetical protein [Neisseria meningitidis]
MFDLLSEGVVWGFCLRVSDFCIGYSDGEYSGLTKTSTALPRLAVLSVLSAASSPCPDFC